MKPLLIRLFAVALLCLTANAAFAAEKIRLDYFVICEDGALGAKIRAGVVKRLNSSNVEVAQQFPAGKLFLYVARDLNDRKNTDGISIAIAHVSNVQTGLLALERINKNEKVTELLSELLREEGFMQHLSVAHLDEASDVQLNVFLDSVVTTFVRKYSRP
ncbi:MAG: exported protein of unknown function [Massilia sp.]|jgi:hypothetical protein|nr:exported protein of unknown function [Massilia sp.]